MHLDECRIAFSVYPDLSKRQYCSQAIYSYMHAFFYSKVQINIAIVSQKRSGFMIMKFRCVNQYEEEQYDSHTVYFLSRPVSK